MNDAMSAMGVTEQLQRIEAKLDAVISGPRPEVIRVPEVMALTGCRSEAALYRLLPRLGVKPYVKGKYRRNEVENAVARLSLNNQLNERKSLSL